MRHVILIHVLVAAFLPGIARADEIFAGVMAHGVDTPFTKDIDEKGADSQIGWRGGRVGWLRFIGRPRPHVFASINSGGNTSFLSAGLSWRLGSGPVYVRPGIGLAVHDGPSRRATRGIRTDLGSPILFAPEISLGVKVTPRVSVEASWVHLSHARLFGGQNPGLDMIGARIAVGF